MLVSSSASGSSDGSIFIVGEPLESLHLSEALMCSDDFDNVTGSAHPDALPDFAGEEICSLLDKANSPYRGYLKASNSSFLRELTVRHVVESLDSVVFISPFDKEGMGRRKAAKLIVLASPYMAAYGRFDADTLFSCMGVESIVISPLDIMMAESLPADGTPVNVGVLADSAAIADRVYESVFAEQTSRKASHSSLLFQGSPRGNGHELVSFLEQYSQAGYSNPLSVLIVDDYSVDIDSLKAELAAIRVELSDAQLLYGSLVSDDFRILDTRSTVAHECYRRLRSSNTFTHNIAYPRARALVSSPSTELPSMCYTPDGALTDDFKYSRRVMSDYPSYMLLQFSTRFIPESILDTLRSKAPKTYSSYVQK